MRARETGKAIGWWMLIYAVTQLIGIYVGSWYLHGTPDPRCALPWYITVNFVVDDKYQVVRCEPRTAM